MENVSFEVLQDDYSGKPLAREFGNLLLWKRELWLRIIEVLLVLILWYYVLKLLPVALMPTGDVGFLFNAVKWIGIAVFILAAAAAGGITVYLMCFRAVVLGSKRLKKIKGWVKYTFSEGGMISESEAGTTEVSYSDFAEIVDQIYERKHAFYIGLTGTNLYMIVQKKCFIIGTPDAFRTFISDKTGKPVKYIK